MNGTGFDVLNGCWVWPKANEKELVHYVLDGCRRHLVPHRLDDGVLAAGSTENGRRGLVRSIYEVLLKYEIRYALEPFSEDKRKQLIRTPPLILDNPREGTCLDLTLLFCGLCLDCGLIPWIVLLDGHAYAVVSMRHPLRDVEAASRRAVNALFEGRRLVTQAEILNGLLKPDEEGTPPFLAVECTGFARAAGLDPKLPEARRRDAAGTLSFDDAVAIGAGHLVDGPRKLSCAIDVGVARRIWGLASDALEPAAARPILTAPEPAHPATATPRDLGVLPYLCDRIEQTDEISNYVMDVVGLETSRPLLFLIPGDQEQHHNGLIRRLSIHDIPRAMEATDDEPAVEAHSFDLPPPLDPAAFDLRLRRNLAKKIGEKGIASPTWGQLTDRLARRTGPTLLVTTFDTSHWEQDRKANFDRIDALLRSWANCGDLPVRRAAIVCVQVVLESPPIRTPDPAAEVLARLDALRPVLEAGAEHPGVVARCLEPLADVGRVHLDNWWQDDLVREFSDDHDFTREVNELFADPAGLRNGRLPMSRVVPRLQEWLKPFAGRS